MKQISIIMAALFCSAAGATVAADIATADTSGATDGSRSTQGSLPTADVIRTADGHELTLRFFGHGSIGFEYMGKMVYVDPVSEYADYVAQPKADVIVVSHEHGDHLDPTAIEALTKPGTVILGSGTAVNGLGSGEVLSHGNVRDLSFAKVTAVPAYNTSPEKQNFHPKDRLHNGYIFDFGGTRVYVAGDSEDTPEMLDLKDIDIAFLPVNLPYTMTEEQAARAVRAIGPHIFYPYHYGGTDHTTDLGKLVKLLDGSGTDVRIRPLE